MQIKDIVSSYNKLNKNKFLELINKDNKNKIAKISSARINLGKNLAYNKKRKIYTSQNYDKQAYTYFSGRKPCLYRNTNIRKYQTARQYRNKLSLYLDKTRNTRKFQTARAYRNQLRDELKKIK